MKYKHVFCTDYNINTSNGFITLSNFQLKCKYCSYIMPAFTSVTMIICTYPECLSDEEKIIKDIIE